MVLTKTATGVDIESITITVNRTYDPDPELVVHVAGKIELVDQLGVRDRLSLNKTFKVNDLAAKLKTNCKAFKAGIKALVVKELGL